MTLFRTLLLGALSAFFAAQVTAAPVNVISAGSLTGTQVATFDDVAVGNFDGIFASGGVGFAERFSGQSLSTSGNFDILSGSPLPGLSLQVGAANQNLSTFLYGGSNVLTGLGIVGYPDLDSIGEGAFAALFSTDQSQFGFDLVGGNRGSATVDFFRRDGSLIQSIVLSGLSSQSYAFAREAGVFDIAGISIYNSDLGGIGFDNLRFDVASTGTPVPEPESLALIALALASMSLVRRRK